MKKYILLISCFLLLVSSSAAAQREDTVTTEKLADLIISEGEKYAGVPYRMGAVGPRAFDCSGFVRYVYAKFGYDLPHSSVRMSELGTPVEGSVSELQKGDLVFFSGRRGGKGVGHVGIYIGPDNNDGSFSFIHAAVKGGVQVSHLKEEYYSSRFLGACRILPAFYIAEPELAELPDTLPVDAVEVRRDTLQLASDDMRIIVFASGRWVRVAEDGSISAPENDSRIVLNANGSWTSVKMSSHTLPSLFHEPAKDGQPSQPADTSMIAPAVPDSVSVIPSETAAIETAGSSEPVFHTVKKGDTLYAISRRYGTSVSEICRLNGISAKSVLKVGKRLKVK